MKIHSHNDTTETRIQWKSCSWWQIMTSLNSKSSISSSDFVSIVLKKVKIHIWTYSLLQDLNIKCTVVILKIKYLKWNENMKTFILKLCLLLYNLHLYWCFKRLLIIQLKFALFVWNILFQKTMCFNLLLTTGLTTHYKYPNRMRETFKILDSLASHIFGFCTRNRI